tara:strand:+ start:173 stop:409 length:237 start_codon:yes stop_codon:yes gene_type:complete
VRETREVIDMTNFPEKQFMEDLWSAEGKMIDTPLGVGTISNVRTKAGIDLEVMVKIRGIDGFTLFSGLKLFANKSVIA